MTAESMCFPPNGTDVVNVRDVRRHIRELLGTDHPKIDDIELLTSEVATNAIVHSGSGRSGGRLTLTVERDDDKVRVEITDDGGADTVPHLVSDGLGEHGRGLWIVRALSDECGSWQDQRGRTTVWFQFNGASDAVVSSLPEAHGAVPSRHPGGRA